MEVMVSRAEGPIIGDEYIGLVTLQGKKLYLEPFIATQLARSGLWDQSPFVKDIVNQKFPLILLTDPISRERWTDEMIDAIRQAYRPDEAFDVVTVFRPRPQGTQ